MKSIFVNILKNMRGYYERSGNSNWNKGMATPPKPNPEKYYTGKCNPNHVWLPSGNSTGTKGV